jgi:uncharacterized protein (TIGR02270 family)
MVPARIIESIVVQHAEELEALYASRGFLSTAPHASLDDLGRLDDRIAAHLDGLRVAGELAWPICEAALAAPSVGSMSTAIVRVIESGRHDRLRQLLTTAAEAPSLRDGVVAGFGWLEPVHLRGVVASLIAAEGAFERYIGLSACALHGVDPGPELGRAVQDPDPTLRACSLRVTGELGISDLRSACADAVTHRDPDCRFWGTWSAVMLGARGHLTEALIVEASVRGPNSLRALQLAALAMNPRSFDDWLREFSMRDGSRRLAIFASGLSGNASYVPWLIGQMKDDTTARVAAEAFMTITGSERTGFDLERPQSEDFEAGPTDDLSDPDVDLNVDEGLLWPDIRKVESWWAANKNRFQEGIRYFAGAPVGREVCIDVLKNGSQRQRMVAAHYLCLLNPGTPLFNTSAPAWRQRRLLANMT